MNLQRIMKKNADKGYEKTKPKQTQTKPKDSKGQDILGHFWFVAEKLGKVAN